MKILFQMDLWTRKFLINFGNHPESANLLPRPNNGAADHIMTANHVFMKSLQEVYLGTRMFPLDFGSHPESTDLCQRPTVLQYHLHIVDTHQIFMMDLWTRKSLLNLGSHLESADLSQGSTMAHHQMIIAHQSSMKIRS